MTRLRRAILLTLALLVVAGVGTGVWVRSRVVASLPMLDGAHRLPGLSWPVMVTRDDLGIPTIHGASRRDVAQATGFLHAQDRFFQMDLSRRRAAGELAALVGARALDADREIRIHRFRTEARRALTLLAPEDRDLLAAYTAGVNEGLAALAAPPFEYLLLRQTPDPWREEDSLLVILSMFITLQDNDGSYESTLATMHDLLPEQMYAFLSPPGTEWDSPVIGPALEMPPIPGPEVYGLRRKRAGRATIATTRNSTGTSLPWESSPDDGDAIGSNNWAVAGRLTDNGAALVANDMHLGIRVPNTWYRAVLEWPTPDGDGAMETLIGTTLPGVPALVTGSNTHVAWGFTNTYADWGDIVLLDLDPADAERYRTPDGWRRIERIDETIRVAGAPDEHETVGWTIWGPLLPPDHAGRQRAYRWVAHSAEQLAGRLTPLEGAHSVEDAIQSVHGLGTPGQNFVVADRAGHIGWTIYGSIPRRHNLDGQLPSSWADGTRGWDGWLASSDYPRIIDPPGGRIWTANARVVDGEMLARLGDGSYEVGSRARVIRERLEAKNHFTPSDFLSIQLDDHAEFLERWRRLLLDTLTPAVTAGAPARAELREIVANDWTGRASPDSAAYRLTRVFRDRVSERVFAFVLAECYEADATFNYNTVRRREGPLWRLVTEKPMHLLDPGFDSWDQMLIAIIDTMVTDANDGRSGGLRARVWSEVNVTAYRHPLSGAVPFLGRWLDMPYAAVPGDLYTPRVASGAIGASERMVVAPGHEAEGIMHMPTGQSGHPMSPFYANSHPAWVEGRATPFLPGSTTHTLALMP